MKLYLPPQGRDVAAGCCAPAPPSSSSRASHGWERSEAPGEGTRGDSGNEGHGMRRVPSCHHAAVPPAARGTRGEGEEGGQPPTRGARGEPPDTTLRRCCVGPHFTGEDTESQGGDATAPHDTGGEGGHR